MHVTGAKRGEIVGEKLSYYWRVKSLTQVLGHLQRTDTVKTRVEGPIIAWENSRHLATLPLVSPPNDVWLVFLWGVILSCSVDPFPGRNNGTMMNVKARENNASAPKRCGAQRVISVKVLLVISMFCKTGWSWELWTWSNKMNLLDILSTSPQYFCRKWIGATN